MKPIRLIHFGGATSPYQRAIDELATLADRYRFETVHLDSRHTETDALRLVIQGEATGAVITSGTLGRFNPRLFVGDLPYVFADAQHARGFWRGTYGQALLRSVEDSGVVVLSCYDGGVRHFFNRVRPIRTTRELSGLRIRVLPNPYHRMWVSILGGTPIEVAPGAFHERIRTGEFDGAERSYSNLTSLDVAKWAPYVSETAHFSLTSFLVVGRRWWSQLTDDDRELLATMAARSEVLERECYSRADTEARETLKQAGTEIVRPDISEFRAKAHEVYQEFTAATGESSLLQAALEIGWQCSE